MAMGMMAHVLTAHRIQQFIVIRAAQKQNIITTIVTMRNVIVA